MFYSDRWIAGVRGTGVVVVKLERGSSTTIILSTVAIVALAGTGARGLNGALPVAIAPVARIADMFATPGSGCHVRVRYGILTVRERNRADVVRAQPTIRESLVLWRGLRASEAPGVCWCRHWSGRVDAINARICVIITPTRHLPDRAKDAIVDSAGCNAIGRRGRGSNRSPTVYGSSITEGASTIISPAIRRITAGEPCAAVNQARRECGNWQ